MKPFALLLPLTFLLSSCIPPVAQTINSSDKSVAPKISLTPAQRTKVANKIWQNESASKINGLTAWNDGENFPSLGIGHFIWYPTGVQGPFTESFPQFIQFAKQRGLTPPAIAQLKDCPWKNKAEFQRVFNTPELLELRTWLSKHLSIQADFIIGKSQASLSKMLAAAPASDRQRVLDNYNKVSTTTNGTYALIDYVNFKGEGINPKERYNGLGWGLLQVLQNMGNTSGGQASATEFSRASKRVLDRRITNSPKSRGEARWRAGWHNRCDTYAKPF